MKITLTLSRPRAEYIVRKAGSDYFAYIDESIKGSFGDQVGIHIEFKDYHSMEYNMLVMFHLGVLYDVQEDLKSLYKPTQFKDISVPGGN